MRLKSNFIHSIVHNFTLSTESTACTYCVILCIIVVRANNPMH